MFLRVTRRWIGRLALIKSATVLVKFQPKVNQIPVKVLIRFWSKCQSDSGQNVNQILAKMLIFEKIHLSLCQ